MLKLATLLGILGLLSQPVLSQPLTQDQAGAACSPPVQTGAAATIPANSIPAVTLRDYERNNGVNPSRIQQVVPVPVMPGQIAGPTIIKAVPLEKYLKKGRIQPEDIENFVPVAPAKPAAVPTGGASPICPEQIIIQPASPIIVPAQPVIKPAPTGGAAPAVRGYW